MAELLVCLCELTVAWTRLMSVATCSEATMGYITPEAMALVFSVHSVHCITVELHWSHQFSRQVAGKFPGYISPSNKLLFSDIPNGLGAISKAKSVRSVLTKIDRYCCCLKGVLKN